jgi:E3 ubiquitin-protein ligase HUWE1
MNGQMFQPSSKSFVNPDHLRFFKFIGRVIGKALYDGYLLDSYFTRSFYKHMLGQSLTFHDMEDIDLSEYNSMKKILENDVTHWGLSWT